MPKRSLDTSNESPDMAKVEKPALKKTERSHEENQERAYIAASRRADRSIEARVKSAQMASEIHKKRTGKGFKISEKIVQAEEMYEEEEDDMPRAYQVLAAHLQTNSPELNYRVNAFLANRVAMASMVANMRNDDWSQNPINKMFAAAYPHANKQAQEMSHRLSNSAYYTPLSGESQRQPDSNTAASPMSPAFGNVDYHQQHQPQNHFSANRTLSMDMSPMSPTQHLQSPALSPALSPGAHTPQQQHFSQFPIQTSGFNDAAYPDSAFTAELPPEAKMLAAPGFDMSDPMAPMFMGRDSMPMGSLYPDPEDSMSTLKHEQQQYSDAAFPMSPGGYYDPSFGTADGNDNGADTPNLGMPNDNWDNYLDWTGGSELPEQQRRA